MSDESSQIRKLLTNVMADEVDFSIHQNMLLERARSYVADSLEAHEHSDGRELLAEIDEALRPDSLYCFLKTKQVVGKLK